MLRVFFKPGFHIIARIVRISKKMFRRPGRSYGNATHTIANDPGDSKFTRSSRSSGQNSILSKRSRSSQSSGSFAIVWVAFPYDRPGPLNIFFETTGTIGTIIWKPGFNGFKNIPEKACVNRGIHADVIVYIFAHLHKTLRTEANMLDTN